MRVVIALCAVLTAFASVTQAATPASLEQVIQSPHRQAGELLRDQYRHPKQTLEFFQVRPEMTVVEIWPGAGGWYTSILAPWLRDRGTLYAAQFPADSKVAFFRRSRAAFEKKLATQPELYDQVKVTALEAPEHLDIAPAGSVDRVLTFRNVHNWAQAGVTDAVFTSFYKALKPGGLLGVVEHRAPAGRPLEEQLESGYMTETYVIEAAEKAGFVLDGNSPVNANPRDTAEHAQGVWTLPPTLRRGDQDREKYMNIGESDRMTLRFRKPGQ
ncbi:class I SAM-dependent methyltransferase [Alloalcanivorax mobilis]|uniref:class I SAM-dependent methyltransferase n=1 Tax=Alloalcanivorax mobilis TaxID=2019569 RepID=UPI000C7761B5|nr:class I SAM-dependent methyltransferase [Alloalcanivorax mobilis]